MRKLFAVLLLLCFSGCSFTESATPPPTLGIEVYRSFQTDSGYSSVYYDGINFLNSEGRVVPASGDFDANPILAVGFSTRPATQYAYFKGTSVPDPLTLNLSSIELYMPYNYISDLNSSNTYLATCLSLGYTLQELKQSSVSAQVTLIKGDVVVRVVVYESTLKIYAKNLETQPWR